MKPRAVLDDGPARSSPVAGEARIGGSTDRRDGRGPSAGEHVLRIRDLASEFDVSFRTLRFYEGRGLIAPNRIGAKRLYSQRDRERLRTILLIKRLGFSLMDAKTLLPLFDEAKRDPQDAGALRRRLEEQRLALLEQRAGIDRALALVPEVLAAFGCGRTQAAKDA